MNDSNDFQNASKPEESVLEALDRATKHFKLCPNRLWAVASVLRYQEDTLPKLVPPVGSVVPEPKDDHSICTIDFCEYSQRDFTSVPQRHEESYCQGDNCQLLVGKFPREVLRKAAEAGESTAWDLSGDNTIGRPRPFMACSHVWSDGTGVGAWSNGQVNTCLYSFFKDIAQRFACEGIWWDSICIPREKAARTKAIAKMQENYENARITVVHDCFLRGWEWTDAKTACLAIVMSPWFSRGWTALELAKSKKVKIIFKEIGGRPVIKDLDEDILHEGQDSDFWQEPAVSAIKNLRRRGVQTVDDLISVLGPRYTSWPRDLAVISGLLVGVDVGASGPSQQGIYQSVLTKFGEISRENLFHNSATMVKPCFSWCPTNIYDLPVAVERHGHETLTINPNGSVTGLWVLICLDFVPTDSFIWNGTHSFVKAKLQLALKDKRKHLLLIKPQFMIGPSFTTDRALLVRAVKGYPEVTCQFVGPVYFQPQLYEVLTDSMREKFRIEGVDEPPRPDVDGPHEEGFPRAEGPLSVTIGSDETSDIYNVDDMIQKTLLERRRNYENEMAESPETRDGPPTEEELAEYFDNLEKQEQNRKEEEKRAIQRENSDRDVNAQDSGGQTALHWAIWNLCTEDVERLVYQLEADASIQDNLGQQPIHLAAERGGSTIVRMLLENGADQYAKTANGMIPLHWAAWSGSAEVIDELLDAKEAITPSPSLHARDNKGRTALHIAAEKGYVGATYKLLCVDTELQVRDSVRQWTPLHWAADGGHEGCVRLLIWNEILKAYGIQQKRHLAVYLSTENQYRTGDPMDSLRTAQSILNNSIWSTSQDAIKMLEKEGESGLNLDKLPFLDEQDPEGRTALHMAVANADVCLIKILLELGQADPNIGLYSSGQTPLHLAAAGGNVEVVEALLDYSEADVFAKDTTGRTALEIAEAAGHTAVATLLRNAMNYGPNRNPRRAKIVSTERCLVRPRSPSPDPDMPIRSLLLEDYNFRNDAIPTVYL